MDFVFSEDIARANLLAAEADVSDETFNVASGVETSLDQLARTLLDVMGSDLEPEYGPERTVNNVTRRLADTSAASRAPRVHGARSTSTRVSSGSSSGGGQSHGSTP